jgi:drug/metabolite transporter (DMT)-like permease
LCHAPDERSALTPLELGLVLGSALLHAVWSAAIKGSRDPLVFNLLQKVGPALLLVATLPLVALDEIPPAVWKLFAATSVAHGLYFYWMSRAYEQGDLTLVYPIARSTPAFLPFLAAPALGEQLSAPGAVGIAIVVVGLWLVQAGRGLSWTSFATPAARFAYLTLAATVAYSLVDKRAMAELTLGPWTSPVPRPLFYCLMLYAGSAVLYVPLTLRRLGARAVARAARGQIGAATLAAALSLVGYGLILKALETAPVSYVVAARQTSVIFALALGVTWLGESPGRARVLGGLATFVGVALIALS